MRRARGLAAVTALAGAVTAAGCGLGAGPSSKGTATVTVTRDYGARQMVDASESDPSASETVLRFLDRSAPITTRYGGGFVQSIDGLAGAEDGGRRYDWFFYVNGIESPIGATDVTVHGGDRVWWDYRDWTAAMRVPTVVGSFPQPFVAAAKAGATVPVDCAGATPPCQSVAGALRDAGVKARLVDGIRPDDRSPRVLVGTWDRVGRDAAAAQIDDGPATSGVFARFERTRSGDYALAEFDAAGAVSARTAPGAGLLAAVRDGDRPPTWLVTGTDASGVERAARLFAPGPLRDRYAVATDGRAPTALPVIAQGAEPGSGSAP